MFLFKYFPMFVICLFVFFCPVGGERNILFIICKFNSEQIYSKEKYISISKYGRVVFNIFVLIKKNSILTYSAKFYFLFD